MSNENEELWRVPSYGRYHSQVNAQSTEVSAAVVDSYYDTGLYLQVPLKDMKCRVVCSELGVYTYGDQDGEGST